jgi:virginiamycin B lyase
MNRNQFALARLLATCCLAVACDALPPADAQYVAIRNSSAIRAMTPGPDGNIWFTYLTEPFAPGGQVGAIGSISPAGDVRTFVDSAIIAPNGITAARDGALWFTDDTEIGRITPAGEVTKFPLQGTHAQHLVEGTDGRIWFTETGDQIGAIGLDGKITEYPLPVKNAGLSDIATASDGVWVVETGLNRIGLLTLAGQSSFQQFPIPTSQSSPQAIVRGADGNLWFTESRAGKIARMSPGGAIVEFTDPGAEPFGIAAAPDGTLWYGDMRGRIANITPAGRITEFPLKNFNQTLWLAVGADGEVWFTATGQIGRLTRSK